ncbi:MAG: cation:proton antiporter [Thermoprotei archaeon]|nr:MAG: cation:proton antiporter [Thermoprotei archaeon]
MDYIRDLVLLLIVAKILGLPLRSKGIHPIVGHVLAGVILGPYVLRIVYPSENLATIANVALLLLLFYTGLTTDFRELKRRGLYVILIGSLGVIATFSIAYTVLHLIGVTGLQALFLAIVISNTATETVAATIAYVGGREIRALIVGASFVDDIFAAFMISIIASQAVGFGNMTMISVLTIVFMTVIFILSQVLVTKYYIIYRLMSKDYRIFAALSIILAFGTALLARLIGLSELIGAYLAGLLIGRGREFHDPLIKTRVILSEFIDDLSVFLEVLFIPMFFTYVGLLLVPASISTSLLIGMLFAAIFGKIIGCTPIAYLSLKDRSKSLLVGFAMIGRGALETALLKLGYDFGIITIEQYSTVIVVALSTTIIAPLLYTIAYRRYIPR